MNPKNAYWDPSLLYLKQSFAQTEWNASSLPQFYNYAVAPTASLNETHWKNPKASKILLEALSATNAKVAADRWHEVQKIQWDQGGYIMYANISNIDAVSKKVTGITPSKVYSLGMPTGLAEASFV
jgi:peptide/nickel transport system substrate-binding protein